MIVGLEMMLWIFRFFIGASIFSFLNVVIYRMPQGESVVNGRSHCMTCGHVLTAKELVPIISYLFLRGRCKNCGERISKRYLIVESIGGAAFVCCGAFYGIGQTGVISLRGLLVFLFLAVLTVVAAIDYDTQMIYDRFHVIIFVLGVAAIWLFPEHSLVSRCIGMFVISLPMVGLAMVIPGAFGGGDIKLMAACGWFLGVKGIVCAMFIGLLTGGIYCVVLLAKKQIGRKEHFAFGPWLAVGLAIAVFFGDFLVDSYLKLL